VQLLSTAAPFVESVPYPARTILEPSALQEKAEWHHTRTELGVLRVPTPA
jgi:hypothetical protein